MSLLTHMKPTDLDVERKEHGWGLEKQQSPEKKGNKRNQRLGREREWRMAQLARQTHAHV